MNPVDIMRPFGYHAAVSTKCKSCPLRIADIYTNRELVNYAESDAVLCVLRIADIYSPPIPHLWIAYC
jgi:hypothetical protein